MRGRYLTQTWRSDPTLYAPRRYRRACQYRAFIPDPLPLDEQAEAFALDLDLSAAMSNVERSLTDLNRIAAPALQALSRFLLRTESIASSKVEDLQADARSLAMAEARRRAGRSVGQQARAIIANIDAMERAVEHAARADRFGVGDLLDIHAVLMQHAPLGRRVGALRDDQNWIGGNDYNPCGADYVPPPAQLVPDLLENLCNFCESDQAPPLAQAALAHAQFETIHPFDDGNGRTGRALIQMLLRRRGLAPSFVPPISVVFSQRRDSYIQGLVDFREGREREWLFRFTSAAAQAVRLANRYRREITELQGFWRERLRTAEHPRADAVAWELIDVLPGMPVLSVPTAVEATGRSQPAVNNAVGQLERVGVLSRIGTSARYRIWEPQGLLDLMVDIESEALA